MLGLPYPPSHKRGVVLRAWRAAVIALKMEVFGAWRTLTLQSSTAQLRAANLRLFLQNVGRRCNSIWAMRKEDLVVVAEFELGWTYAQACGQTVAQLRVAIRSNREVRQPVDLLKGISRWKKEQLVAKCLEFNVQTTRVKPDGLTVPLNKNELTINLKAAAKVAAAAAAQFED